MLDNYDYRHILRIYNTYFFSTATMVPRTCFSVSLYVNCLSLFYFNERMNLGEISTVSFSPVVLGHIQNIVLLNYNVKLHLIYESLRKSGVYLLYTQMWRSIRPLRPIPVCFLERNPAVLYLICFVTGHFESVYARISNSTLRSSFPYFLSNFFTFQDSSPHSSSFDPCRQSLYPRFSCLSYVYCASCYWPMYILISTLFNYCSFDSDHCMDNRNTKDHWVKWGKY